MGYDYEIRQDCDHCDQITIYEHLYTSYNHAWAFYDFLDKDQGLRWIYDKTGEECIEPLEKMLETMRTLSGWHLNFENQAGKMYYDIGTKRMVPYDGWSTTIGNAYWFSNRILITCKKYPKGRWSGD